MECEMERKNKDSVMYGMYLMVRFFQFMTPHSASIFCIAAETFLLNVLHNY